MFGIATTVPMLLYTRIRISGLVSPVYSVTLLLFAYDIRQYHSYNLLLYKIIGLQIVVREH